MKEQEYIKNKLETLIEFQEKHPKSHVGGSIGLFLRGIDLQRNLSFSDLDITIDEFNEKDTSELYERSDFNDFDYALKKYHDDGFYTKIDIRVNPESSFDVIVFEGNNYNVSKLIDILFWKKKYANKGVRKHKNDIITIETGIRPIEPKAYKPDDLPF